MSASPHHVTIIDRGTVHVHRWRAECACGRWRSRNKRRKCQAAKEYRDHLHSTSPARDIEMAALRRRRPTPRAELPDALRTPS